MRNYIRFLGCLFFLSMSALSSAPLLALEQSFSFENACQQQDFDNLLKEIRCVTCPNQNIADSNAPVAKAMQEEIFQRLKKGESTLAIREYLLSHYGDYVFYRPLMKKQTWLLWGGPFLMLLIGFIFYLKTVFTAKRAA